MPSVRPLISWLPVADLSQIPACSARSRSISRRAKLMISATANSTTLRVLEKGALNTATPAVAAATRSTWLVPMQKAPTAANPGTALHQVRGHLGLRPNAQQVDPVQGRGQVALVQRS